MGRATNKRRGATELPSLISLTKLCVRADRLSSDQLYGWLPPEALAEHIERLSNQIAALAPQPRKSLDKIHGTARRALAVELLDLKEHVFAEQQDAINGNRMARESKDGTGSRIVLEHQAVYQSQLVRYSTESLFKTRQSPLICWPNGLPKDEAWMGYMPLRYHDDSFKLA